MKASILFSILIMVLTAAIATPKSADSLVTVGQQRKNNIALKLDKKLIGAHVEVISSNGDCLICQKASGRKMNIHLNHVEPGNYTLRIEKDGVVEEFQLIKK